MYRQYENPRTLEKELNSLKTDYSMLSERIKRHNVADYSIEELEEMQLDLHNRISDLEQRVNFAWQDEEFG